MLIRNPAEPKDTTKDRTEDQGHLNQVLVVGRITPAPTVREPPSGSVGLLADRGGPPR